MALSNEDVLAAIKKNPVSFGCGLLSLVFAVAVYFRSGAIPEAEAELAQKAAAAERYALNLKNAVQLKEQHEELVAANKAVDARIIRAGDLGSNSTYFFRLFSESGVKQVDFRQVTTTVALPKGGKTAFVPVAFSVSVQGTLPRILDFLRLLENGPHYCRVLTAQCTGNPALRAAPLTLTLNLEILGQP